MKGTEKQIKWADEIKETVTKAIDQIVNEMVSDPRYDANNAKMAAVVADAKAIAEAIKNVECAANLVFVYGDVRASMTSAEVWRTIRAARKFTVANNEEQKKLLNR